MPNIDTIDERVVEMRIDNRQFVKGANNTISVLDKLKNALNFKKSTDSFDEISRSANRMDLSGVSKSIDSIAEKFSFFGRMGQRIIENLTDSIYSFFKRTLNDLTIANLSEGWGKYEEITSSIHTIMAATADSWQESADKVEFTGTQLEHVNSEMEKLNWFTDETSYNLRDIVNNVGKFTNAGILLSDASIEMMGIAAWGGKAGATVGEVSRAMYNLSQAMSIGKVTMMDWRSIENANMATMEFKQTAIDTAVALGTLKKTADDTYTTLQGKEVTTVNFRDTLSDGWFTGDVLAETLKEYGHFSNELSKITSNTVLTARDVLNYLDEYRDGTFDVVAAQNELAKSYATKDIPTAETFYYILDELTKEEYALSESAFRASQETKTFTEAINATKDAVSTGWMKTFQYIFGDYEESKDLWSNVTDELYALFAEAGNRRNSIFKIWHDEGGRDALLEALTNVYNAIMNLIQPIRDAFNDIFSWGSVDDAGNKLIEITKRFRDFTERISISQDTIDGIRVVFTKVFGAARTFFGYVKEVLKVVGKVFGYITRIVGAFFRAFSSGSFDSQKFSKEISEIFGDIGEKIKNAWEQVKAWINSLRDLPVIGPILNFFINTFDKIYNYIKNVVEKIKAGKEEGKGLTSPWQGLLDLLKKVWEYIKGIFGGGESLKKSFESIGDFFKNLWNNFLGKTEGARGDIKTFFSNAFQGIGDAIKDIDFKKLISIAKVGILGFLSVKLANLASSFTSVGEALKAIPQKIGNVLDSIQDFINAKAKSENANTYLKIAGAVLMLAGAIFILSGIDNNKFVMVAITLAGLFFLLAKAAKSLEKTSIFSGNSQRNFINVNVFNRVTSMMIGIAAVLLAAGYALKQIAGMKPEQIVTALITLAVIVGMAVAAMAAMIKLSKQANQNVKSISGLIAIAAIIFALGNAMAKLGTLNIANIAVAAGAMTVTLAAVALVLHVIGQMQTSAKGIFGAVLIIAVLTAAITALVLPMMALAQLPIDKAAIGVGIILALTTILAAFLWVGSKLGESSAALLKFAAIIAIIAAALTLFAIAASLMVPAIIALMGVIGKFLSVLTSMSEEQFNLLVTRLLLFGTAVTPLVVAFTILSAGALILGAGLLVAAVAVSVFGLALLKVAAGISLVSSAFKKFMEALHEMMELSDEYGDRLTEGVKTFLHGILTAILDHATLFANAALTILLAIVQVITDTGGSELSTMVQDLLVKLMTVIGTIANTLINFLVGFVVYIINAVADAISANRNAFVYAIEKIIGTILGVVVDVFMSLIGDVVGAIIEGFDAIFGTDYAEKVREWFQQAGDDAAEAIETYMTAPAKAAEAAGENAGGTFAETMAKGTSDNGKTVTDAITGVIGNASTEANNLSTSNGQTIGYNFDVGIGNGLYDGMPQLDGPIGDVSAYLTNGFANNLGIHSPSRVGVQMGRYWDLGIAFGIRDNAGSIVNENNSLTNAMVSSLQTAMAIVGRIADEDLSLSPLITPVVDMSNVSSSAASMNDMFNSSIDMGAINSRVANTSDYAAAVSSAVDSIESDQQPGDTYQINIYSSPGMDENELANIVMYKIQNGIARKGAALG